MTQQDKARKLVERLNDTLGGVQVPDLMHGDNLAIMLCTAYDNPDQDTDDETGWTPDAISRQEAGLAAIRAHYAPLADLITAQAEENRRLREALQPFADVAEHDIGSDEADCDVFRPMFGANRAPYLTVSDLRRARAALSSTGEKG